MAEKNRFSKLLKYLMQITELKNATIASQLQYDASYISKWTSGRLLPAGKTEKKILEGLSSCIVQAADEGAQNRLLSEYQVNDLEELKSAIYDNLEAEYTYCLELQKNTSQNVIQKTFYFPEMTLDKYISKMKHPVLRRVKALNVMAVIDLMDMGHEYQLKIIQTENMHIPKGGTYPDVFYSMLIRVRPEKWDFVYDTIFLIYMLNCNTYVNFNLYGDEQAAGRIIFTVKNEYAISGMLISQNYVMSVNTSEEYENCSCLYQNIKSLCNRERLLFRRTTIEEMIKKHDYIQSILSMDQRWILGHVTEHFLSDELFEEILEALSKKGEVKGDTDKLRGLHQLTANIMKESSIRLLIYQSAFYRLLITNELDFYSHKVTLTTEQRSRYLEHLLFVCKEYENLDIRLISGRFVPDFEYSDNWCVLLSNMISYLRLEGKDNHLLIVNRLDMRKIFDKSFEAFWDYGKDTVETDRGKIMIHIEHMIRGVRLLLDEK